MLHHQVLEDLIPGSVKTSVRTDLIGVLEIIQEMLFPEMHVLASLANGWVT